MKAVKRALRNNQPLNDEAFEGVKSKIGLRFYGWAIMSAAAVSRRSPHMERIDFLMKFIGRTRHGQELMSAMGWTGCVRTLDDSVKAIECEAQQKIRSGTLLQHSAATTCSL